MQQSGSQPAKQACANNGAYANHLRHIQEYSRQLSLYFQDFQEQQDDIRHMLPEDMCFKTFLANMRSALQHFLVIVEKNIEKSPNGAEGEKYWVYVRHDMRGALGTVSGYYELICSEIENHLGDAFQPVASRFHQHNIHDIVESIMNIIDAMRDEPHRPLLRDATDHMVAEENAPYDAKHAAQYRILIVSENAFKCRLLSRRLGHMGHRVRQCSGLDVIDTSKVYLPDLLILDLDMPAISGMEIMAQLKADAAHRTNMPILVMAEPQSMHAVVACSEIMKITYLPVPFNGTLLYERVNMCLGITADALSEPGNMVLVDRNMENGLYRDALTGLWGHKGLWEKLDNIVSTGAQQVTSCGIILIDINGFSNINQRYGRDSGDALLCSVADRLTQALDHDEYVSRLGGDEFGILIPGISLEDFDVKTAFIKNAIGSSFSFQSRIIPFSYAIGTALFPQDGDVHEAFYTADYKLYMHKSTI